MGARFEKTLEMQRAARQMEEQSVRELSAAIDEQNILYTMIRRGLSRCRSG